MIEVIKVSREEIHQEILQDEEEKRQIEFQLQVLNEKLTNVNTGL